MAKAEGKTQKADVRNELTLVFLTSAFCLLPLALTAFLALRAQALSPLPQAPLTVVLLLDVTASMTYTPLTIDQRFAQVFNAFQQGLRPADRGAVGVIAGTVRFSSLTSDRRELALSARRLLVVPDATRLGPSPLWDAIDEALTLVSDAGGPSAVVLFSDGRAGGNRHGLDEILDRAKRLRVSISAVVEGSGSVLLARSTVTLDPAENIDRLTRETGGKRLLDRPPDPRQRNPGPLVSLIMDGLHGQPVPGSGVPALDSVHPSQ